MRACLLRDLLGVLVLCTLMPALTGDVSAQHPGTGQGARGPISQDELRARVERQEDVDGYIIRGGDLIAIIQEATDAITIKDAIIGYHPTEPW
jgi:hypothetical protein